MAYLFGILTETVKVIREDDGYVVQEVRVGDDEYLEMYGRLNSGISFIMRTPVESIRESVKVGNLHAFWHTSVRWRLWRAV